MEDVIQDKEFQSIGSFIKRSLK